MRVIGLDESGKFEEQQARDIRFVGGYAFDINKNAEDDLEANKKDLSKKFKLTCDTFTKECHKNTIENTEIIRLAEELEITLNKIDDSYRFAYPLSLHCGNKNTIFKFEPKENSRDDGKYVPIDSNADKNLDAWCSVFKEKLYRLAMKHIKSKNGHLFCFLYPNPIVNATANVSDSNILHFKSGANLYEYMAQFTVLNQLMYGFDKPDTEYFLEFATRSLPGDRMPSYENYQFDPNENRPEESRTYKITVPSTYKTMLATALYDPDFYNSEYSHANYHLDVRPIKYCDGKAKKQKILPEERLMPYHYLADIVCSAIRKELRTIMTSSAETDGEQLESISKISFKKNEHISLEIRIMDECEKVLRKMIKAVYKIDLVQYFEAAYELQHIRQNSRELNTRQFYINYWMKKADEHLAKKMNEAGYFSEAVNQLPEYCKVLKRYMTVDAKYAVGLYVAEKLLEQISIMDNDKKRNLGESMFSLYDICLRGYNHEGSNERAAQAIAQAEYYAGSVSIDEYIDYSIRCLQHYFNRLDFVAALSKSSDLEEMAKPYLSACKQLYAKSKKIISGIAFPKNDLEGRSSGLIAKIYSNIGQACAYLSEPGDQHEDSALKIGELDAHKAFTMALDIYDNLNDRGNYYISLSHYLHFLCHINDRREYEKYIPQYLGSSDLTEQFGTIKQEKNKYQTRFYLRVYLKAILTFYPDKVYDAKADSGIAKDIWAYVEENYEDAHPWPLICANLYEILWKNAKGQGKSLDSKYEALYQKATLRTEQSEDQDTIDIIKLRFKIHMTLLNEPSARNKNAASCLAADDFFIIGKFNFKEYSKSSNLSLEELYNLLNKYVRYEYC